MGELPPDYLIISIEIWGHSMRIIGIDPGLATIGYGVLAVNPTPIIEDFGVITTPAHTPMEQRLALIYTDMTQLLTHWQPDMVIIEKFFFYRMGNTIMIAQARGVILLCLAQSGVAYQEFSPTQVKQTLTGFGHASKHDVQAAVQQELALIKLPRPDDAADALALALTGLRHQSL